MLHITNTLTQKKEIFNAPDHKVTMYVCGITPYDYSHIGHGRVYVSFDVVYRLLSLLGYSVTYCRNFTDIDDKLIAKAQQRWNDGLRYKEIANEFIAAYEQDMKRLGCKNPDMQPRVTDHIPQIIACITRLIAAGKAYVVDNDVYFSIPSFPAYGALSKQKLDDLRAGARVEINDKKRDVLDFALWKGEKEGTFWQSPWGWGRPGWHIECSALAHYYLGEHIDLHAGGQDLIFPHHENEIAQSEGMFGAPFARYWAHNGFVTVNQEKMSKSLGNFFTLREVFNQFDPMVVRFYILSHHYRAPLEFSYTDMQGFEKSYKKLCRLLSDVQSYSHMTPECMTFPLIKALLEMLTDDLNTPGMFGVLFDNIDALRDVPQAQAVKTFLQQILGLSLEPIAEKTVEITPIIAQLLKEREQARVEKNYARADELRIKLQELGVSVQDKKQKKHEG
jgi:cysteinyl-tRNA synthetase